MRNSLAALCLIVAASCSPPQQPSSAPAGAGAADAPTVAEAPETYVNAWSADVFSTFHHSLRAPSGGAHTVTISAETNSPGGETVAVYLPDADGRPMTGWRLFVVASTRGETESRALDFPASGVQPVVVVVENASGRTFEGHYSITVE
ncbi:MAG: hypothetical protein R3C25_01815 [Hyphomonadaceae bacterium]